MRSIHRAIASCTALCAASSLLLALACGGSESTGPSTGIVLIRASNTGPGLDPDGYVVAVDGGTGQSLPVNGSVTFNQLSVGSHQFLLSGVATNCTLLSPNPVTVAVTAGDTAQATFQLSCGAPLRPIAFSSNRDYSTSIYAMNADGSGVVQLTNNPPDYRLRDGAAAWSPDGTRIAFWTTRDGDWEVWMMNADGRSLTRLTNSSGLFDSTPIVWSSDGRKMAFQSFNFTASPSEIYVLNADGSSLVNVTNNAAADGGPVWSPNGSKIAFWTNRDGNDEIYVMNADGSNPVNFTNNPAADRAPAWSPDGQKIAFETDRDGKVAIYVMNADGSGSAAQLINTAADDWAPVWSPDGTKIGFHAGGDIYVMNADGSNPVNVTNTPDWNDDIVWSPDGRTIAFQTLSNSSGFVEIWVVNADGSSLKPIAGGGTSNSGGPAWRPR